MSKGERITNTSFKLRKLVFRAAIWRYAAFMTSPENLKFPAGSPENTKNDSRLLPVPQRRNLTVGCRRKAVFKLSGVFRMTMASAAPVIPKIANAE